MTNMTAATIIPNRIAGNNAGIIFLDLLVDYDFDKKSFSLLIKSFKYNDKLQYITLVRTTKSTDGTPVSQRSIKELQMLVKAILELPNLEMLDFEGFSEEELERITPGAPSVWA